MKLPTFETKRLILKELKLEHAPNIQKYFNDWEIIRVLAKGVPWPYPDDGAKQFMNGYVLPNQGNDQWIWGIFLKEEPNELVGVVDLWREGHPEHRGFWLAKHLWGKGIMTEAVTPVMDYAFDDLGFEVIVFANAISNIGSRRVKEKTGAKLIRKEQALFVDPNITEREIWELTKAEWKKFKTK